MSFLKTMYYYFSFKAVLQGITKNDSTEKQIEAEIQVTLKHVPVKKLAEDKI